MNEYSWQEEDNINIKNKNKNKKEENYDDDFQGQQNNIKKQKNSIALPLINKSTNNKTDKTKFINANISDQENYQNDFQQPSQKKLKQKQKIKDKKVKNKRLENNSPDVNSNFRNSVAQSPKTKAKNSPQKPLNIPKNKGIQKNQSIKLESKYLGYLKAQFPHTKQQITQLSSQKINRLNLKLKSYIQKVNDQLTDLINQNMRKLKAGTLKINNETKTVDDQIKLLMQLKKNRQFNLQTIQNQRQKLLDKQGSLKQQEFQINADYQIQQAYSKIKELNKEIYDLKLNMKNQGNKLTQQKNYSEKSLQAKSKLINAKRQDQKNVQKLQKYQNNLQQLTSKTLQIQTQLQKLIQQAKRQNIKIPNGHQDKKKAQKLQQLKKKFQNLKLHKDKSTNLVQTKVNILKRDNQVQASQISLIQKRLNQIDTQIDFTQQNSKNLIQQSKKKHLQPYIQSHLDFVYKNITQGNPLTKSIVKFSHSSKQKITKQNSKFGVKKYSSVTNANLYARSQSEVELKPSFHITKKLPLDLKAKQKNVLKLSDKTSQRIWKQQKPQNNSQQTNLIQKQVASKPSLIKKPIINQIQDKSIRSNKNQQQIPIKQSKQSQKQNQKSSNLGPKMKFKKQEDKNDDISKAAITQKDSNQIKLHQNKQQNQKQDQRQGFRIKKAVKQKIQIPDEDLYLFPNNQKVTQKIIKSAEPQKSEDKTITNVQIKRGPNFKLTKPKTQQNASNIQEKSHSTSPINNSQNIKQVQKTKIQQQIKVQQEGVNFGGRRQIQRKIQRKPQQSYI